jgi:acetylglutamate kinase
MYSATEELRANVLAAALPYIQRYTGHIVVIKYGGSAMSDPALKRAVMGDIVLLSLVGVKVVLVHGGGPEITGMLARLGIESRFTGGLRYTDEATAEVVQMVLAGKTNKDLVALIGACGGKAVGLCGIDGGMIKAVRLKAEQDLGYVGDIAAIDPAPIRCALQDGYIPVIASVAAGVDGKTYNINADTAAAAIAAALNAENLIALTDIRGLMRDVKDESTLIPSLCVEDIDTLAQSGIIAGGMIPKIRSLETAVRAGVGRAAMIDGRIPHSLLIEMFSDEGIGTMITK